jgi:hypothetical protein
MNEGKFPANGIISNVILCRVELDGRENYFPVFDT